MQRLFEQEYPKYEKSLFLLAVTYLHNTEDARDVVQEAALAAWRNLHTLRQPKYFKTWLTRIVINRCKSFLRSRTVSSARGIRFAQRVVLSPTVTVTI